MQLVRLNINTSITYRTGDNSTYSRALREGTLLCMTDDNAGEIIRSGGATKIADIQQSIDLIVPPPSMCDIVPLIPALINRNVVAPLDCAKLLLAFGVGNVINYPVEVQYSYTSDNVTLPCMSEIAETDMSWDNVSISGQGPVSSSLSKLNYCVFWIPISPRIHPMVAAEIISALSELYDYVVVLGQSAIQLDLYRSQNYNIRNGSTVIDLIGRVGDWDEVVRIVCGSDMFVTPAGFLARIGIFTGVNTAVIGPYPWGEGVGVGEECSNSFECGSCGYEFCPSISRVSVDIQDGELVFSSGWRMSDDYKDENKAAEE